MLLHYYKTMHTLNHSSSSSLYIQKAYTERLKNLLLTISSKESCFYPSSSSQRFSNLIFQLKYLMSEPLEHDYIGLKEHSLCERSSVKMSSSSSLGENDEKSTELRLGLPGSGSPERSSKHLFSLFDKDLVENKNSIDNLSNCVSGGKRGFLDTIYGSNKWDLSMNCDNLFSGKEGNNGDCSNGNLVHVSSQTKKVEEKNSPSSNDHASKAQVVGWPPIRSFRKNTLAASLYKSNDVEGETEKSGCLYVKVSMDGAPFLRKVDLKHYSNYKELSSALEKMFSCFTIGQCSSPNIPGHGGLSKSHLMDLLHGSEYVLTYEDKDSDWMLVGDVPWRMFLDSCKRLRIVRSTDAIGLAPGALQSKNQN